MKTTEPQMSAFLDALLQPENFCDYCPNGLQVQGGRDIGKIVSGVTACAALIEAAADARADAIVVHHGLFWRSEVRVVGWLRARLELLLRTGMHLYAYHLPLDAHAELGNNAQLGLQLELQASAQRFGEHGLGWIGQCLPQRLEQFASVVQTRLNRAVTVVGESARMVQKVAWCTGGAQHYFEEAIAAGVDVFVSGEISEPQAHYAREMGVAYIAAGHHATERYGVAAVTAHAAQYFGIAHQFIDIDNPA